MMINLGNFMKKMIRFLSDIFINVLLIGKVFDTLDEVLGCLCDFGLSFREKVLERGLVFRRVGFVQGVRSIGVADFVSGNWLGHFRLLVLLGDGV